MAREALNFSKKGAIEIEFRTAMATRPNGGLLQPAIAALISVPSERREVDGFASFGHAGLNSRLNATMRSERRRWETCVETTVAFAALSMPE